MSNSALITVKRVGAERARRLAVSLPRRDDQARMLAYADELEAQADTLERAEKTPSPVSTPTKHL